MFQVSPGWLCLVHNAPCHLSASVTCGDERRELRFTDFDERELRGDKKPLSSTRNGTDATLRIVAQNSLLIIHATPVRFQAIFHPLWTIWPCPLISRSAWNQSSSSWPGSPATRLIKLVGASCDLILIGIVFSW